MDPLAGLAAEWGIEPSYFDGHGRLRTVDADTLRRIIEIVSRGQSPQKHRWLPPVIVLRRGRGSVPPMPDIGPSASIDWKVTSADTTIASGSAGPGVWHLPDDLPAGTF